MLACTAFRVIIDLVCVTEVLACTVLARMAISGCVGVHSISCYHRFGVCTEVLACTVLARMAILGCVGVHSISCDHERVCILHKCRRAPRFYYHCVVTLPTQVF